MKGREAMGLVWVLALVLGVDAAGCQQDSRRSTSEAEEAGGGAGEGAQRDPPPDPDAAPPPDPDPAGEADGDPCPDPAPDPDPRPDPTPEPAPEPDAEPDPDPEPDPDADAAGGDGADGGSHPCQPDPAPDPDPEPQPSPECVLADALVAAAGDWPIFVDGNVVFGSEVPRFVAGEFNDWEIGRLMTAPICEGRVHAATVRLEPGRYQYKLVTQAGDWGLDPHNPGFAYDDFPGNPDARNSVVNTPDSGVGSLVTGPDLCFEGHACPRHLVAYLPAGYGARQPEAGGYPVLFMHDGQNVFDDTDCCFGHTGWEINRTLDEEIAAGRVDPVVVVAIPNSGGGRGAEYALPEEIGGRQREFMRWQVDVVHAAAERAWNIDLSRAYVAGSSFGGVLSLALAVDHPGVYLGAASLSGTFWYGEEEGASFFERVQAAGKRDVALYLDHGGSEARGGDNYEANLQMLDVLSEAGWRRAQWPNCGAPAGGDDLCHLHVEDANHDELAWRDRAHAFLRFFLAPGDDG